MALGWATALKLIPWGDVIQATPQLVKAAKSLLDRNKEAPQEETNTSTLQTSSQPPGSHEELLLQQVHHLEQRIADLEQSNRASAQLIEQLAQQNAQVVQTVGLLRTGAQRLYWACGILSLTVTGLLIYVVRLS